MKSEIRTETIDYKQFRDVDFSELVAYFWDVVDDNPNVQALERIATALREADETIEDVDRNELEKQIGVFMTSLCFRFSLTAYHIADVFQSAYWGAFWAICSIVRANSETKLTESETEVFRQTLGSFDLRRDDDSFFKDAAVIVC